MFVNECVSCDTLVGKIKPPGGVVYENEHWIVFLRSRPMAPGYSFIVLKRHCEHLAELTPKEVMTFGSIMQKTCLALSQVLQPKPAKIYVSSWGEGVKHIHFHVLPRSPKMPAGNRAVSLLLHIYSFLNRLGLKKAYSDEEVARIAEQVRAEFQRLMQNEIMKTFQIRQLNENDRDWVVHFVEAHWGSTKIVSHGRIHYADALSGFVAMREDKPIGLVTYRIERDECEIVTLNSLVEGIGVGSALIAAVKNVAISARCKRLWLITTNDNLAALRFYQKRGFLLVALHRNALELSRRLKPEIPLTGIDGIPLRDEIELELLL